MESIVAFGTLIIKCNYLYIDEKRITSVDGKNFLDLKEISFIYIKKRISLQPIFLGYKLIIRGDVNMIEYNEKVYKGIRNAGTAGIVLGILTILAGVAIGTMSIVYGGTLLDLRKHLID